MRDSIGDLMVGVWFVTRVIPKAICDFAFRLSHALCATTLMRLRKSYERRTLAELRFLSVILLRCVDMDRDYRLFIGYALGNLSIWVQITSYLPATHLRKC